MTDVFRISVETVMNPSSVRAYADAVSRAITQLEAAATKGQISGPALQQNFTQLQVASQVGLPKLAAQPGGVPVGLERSAQISLDRLARVYDLQTLEGAKLEAAVARGSTVAEQAQRAQLRADQERQAAAEREAIAAQNAANKAAASANLAVARDRPLGGGELIQADPRLQAERAAHAADLAEAQRAGRRQAAAEDLGVTLDPEATRLQQEIALEEARRLRSTQARAAAAERLLSGDQAEVELQARTTAALAAAQRQAGVATRLAEPATRDAVVGSQAQSAVVAAEQRAALARQLLSGDERERFLQARTERALAQRAEREEVKARVAAAGGEERGGGGGGGGVGSFLGGPFLGGNIARVALVAGGVLTVAQSVRAMVDEAEKAQVALGQVASQLENTGKADQFPRIRQDILDMGLASGISVAQVAGVAQTMLGAFTDVDTAITATREGLAAMQVDGLNADQVRNLFVAIPKAFELTQEEISHLNDGLLHMRDVFGVTIKDIADGVASIAPLAASIGLNVHQTEVLVSAAASASGRSGGQVASELGRAFTQIEKQAIPILQLFQNNPVLRGELPQAATEIGQGQSGQVLLTLIQHWHDLTGAQQANFLQLIGGRREFASLAALLGQTDKVTAALADTSTHEGRTASALAEYHKTLAFQITQAQAAFRQLGEALVRSGVGDALTDIARAGGFVLTVIDKLLQLFAEVNAASHGVAGRLLEIVVALKALSVLQNLSAVRGAAAAAGEAGAGALGRARAGSAAGGLIPQGASGAALVGAASVVEVGGTYADTRSQLDQKRRSFEASLRTADDATLANLAKVHDDFWTGLGNAVFGSASRADLAKAEQQKRRFAPLAPQITAATSTLPGAEDTRRAVEAAYGIDAQGGSTAFSKILADARAGQRRAVDAINSVITKLRQDPARAADLNGAISAAQVAKAEQDRKAAAESGQVVQSVSDSLAAYQAGNISEAEHLANLRAAINIEKQVVAQGTLDKAISTDLAKNQKDLATLESQSARALVDAQLAQAEIAGGGTAQEKARALTTLLASGKLTDPAEATKAANDIVTAEKAVVTEQANMADTAAEKLRILSQGVAIPQTVRVAELYNLLNVVDVRWQEFIRSTTSSMQGAADLAMRVAKRSIDNAISATEALRQILEEDIASIQSNLEAWRKLNPWTGSNPAALAQLEKDRASLAALPSAGLSDPKVAATAKGSGDELAAARKAAAAEAKAAADKAKAEAKAAHKAEEDTAKARLALLKAQHEGDPVAQAQVSIDEARQLISFAETEAESLNAQAQLVTAQHQLALAQQSVQDAYRNIDKAMAQAAGDTVRVAELEIAQAREHIDNARARGDVLGDLQAQAELIAAQASATASQISVGERNTDFLLQMEQITTNQALAQLEALLKVPGITAEQTQQLLLKIQSLRKSVSQDLAFDIPSDIRLPTLYEVRRAIGSTERGVGYNDNRQISISVTANNMTDLNAIAATFASQFSAPSRYGSTPRIY